jgi:hypothetical protein
MSDVEFYREQAFEALKNAAASDLPNVKTRHILAAEAWQRFADKAEAVREWRREHEGLH